MAETEKKDEKVKCFAFHGYRCEILIASVPRDCKDCRFKKEKRDVTDGKFFPYVNYGSK